MTLSDSLAPSGLDQQAQAPMQPEPSAADQMATCIDGLVSTGLNSVYGPASEQARLRIAQARASEGPDAFGRIVSNPSSFAPVTDAGCAPHLHAAYVYQEQVAGQRGDRSPNTHLLNAPNSGSQVGSEGRDGRGEDMSAAGRGPDDPYISLGPTRDALEIRRLLDPTAHPSSLDYGVTRDDVDAIGAVIRAFPSVEHGSRVLAELDDATLQRWADNLDDHALQGGLDAGERRTHYATLAKNLDATQFTRFADAVLLAGNARGVGVNEARWFSYSAAETAAAETLATFAEKTIARGLLSKDDSLAPAVAEAMSGLVRRDPSVLARVLAPYTEEDTQWLVSGAVFDQISTGLAMESDTPVTTIDHDAVSLSRALEAVAAVGNVETKGLFFASAGRELATLRALPTVPGVGVVNTGAEEAAGHVRIGLSHIVHSDPASVMASVARQTDPEGISTVAYAGALLAVGQADGIRTTLERLLQGESRQELAIERFGPESGEPSKAERDRAAALGHFAGAVAGAIEKRSSDRAEQADALTSVFAGVITVGVSAASPGTPAGRIAQGAASALARPLAESITSSINTFAASDVSLRDTLMDIARPQVPNVGSAKGGVRFHEGQSTAVDFTSSFNGILLNNHINIHR